MKRNIGQLLLAIYLIIAGAIGLFHISLGALWFLLPVLALAAGILLLLGK